jgi:hypothetical protein
MAKWAVSGINEVRGKFVKIDDSVQGVTESDYSGAMKKARKKYPRAPELSVSTKATTFTTREKS